MPDESSSPPLPAPPSPASPPLRSFGGYEIESELGRGGMGVVYLARQVELNRHVALKMLTGHYGPRELQRFMEEAETAAGLNHTNIAHIYEIGEHEGAPFYSLEFVRGGSLADRIRKELPTPHDAAELMMTIARALHFAHEHHVVHRDMKPANVLLDPDGVPKITDFGIAKRLNDDSQLTRSGMIVGTPTYMAPEQAKGNSKHVGPGADIYSLGTILYEMLAGRPPFLPEDSETAIAVRVLTEEPVSPAWHRTGIPRELETICMKCLQKEPRDRYKSAAALAEDLRRFLDDEPILARPPNTFISGAKWVRRNPWKFFGVAAAVILVVAGLGLLARWEYYQRAHTEYAAQVIWVNGVLQPMSHMSQTEAAKHPAYLRVTRRGWYGPVQKVEVLNSRGNPAVLRPVLNEEMITVYMEGLTGVQPYTERTPETATVEFMYDDQDRVSEAVSRDRNSQVNWRLIYDGQIAAGADNIFRARWVNQRGFDAGSRNGASHLEFERDAKGRDQKITFFNAAGKPAANGEGVFGYKLDHDDAGHITRLVNFDADGKPMANRGGLISVVLSWGKEIRFEPRDAQGQAALWNGIAAVVTELDPMGNAERVSLLGAEGKPLTAEAFEWSVQEIKRDPQGETVQRTYFKPDPSSSLKQVKQYDFTYDDLGHPAEIKFTGATPWRTLMRHDASGNVTEEKFLDGKGAPNPGQLGYAMRRVSYTSGPQGLRIEETYFDGNDQATYSAGGYRRTITEFDAAGALKKQTADEFDPARFNYYRRVNQPEYDAQGRTRRSVTRYEDANGQLSATARITVVEEDYDENGRTILEWKTANDPQEFGGVILRTDTEWNPNGTRKRRVRQVCDGRREPLAVSGNGDAAHTEEIFGLLEKRDGIYETGFKEALVGFSTRESKFTDGALRSVVHKREDGTVLSTVMVIITSVSPAADQPKAAELKVGDQLVAAGGKPVTSAVSFTYTSEYPGGSIELLRDGTTVRLDGFKPGSIGATVQDRAAAKK